MLTVLHRKRKTRNEYFGNMHCCCNSNYTPKTWLKINLSFESKIKQNQSKHVLCSAIPDNP